MATNDTHRSRQQNYTENLLQTDRSQCLPGKPKMSSHVFFSGLKTVHVAQHASVYHNERHL